MSFQLFSLRRLNFTPRIIRVLRAFRFIWSSTSSSNCSIFLEYSSNLKFVILLSSSNCSNLFVLFSANVLVSLTLLSISFRLLFSWFDLYLFFWIIQVLFCQTKVPVYWSEETFFKNNVNNDCENRKLNRNSHNALRSLLWNIFDYK